MQELWHVKEERPSKPKLTNRNRNHINRNTDQKLVITEHRLEQAYDFDWDNVKILNQEKC